MGEPHTKGTHVLSAVKVLRANRERALALLPSELHKYLEERILASAWYPLEEHVGLLRAIAQLWPAGGESAWMLMGRATAQSDLTGLYRLHLKDGDPARSLASMTALWRTAHDTGNPTIERVSPTEVTLTLADFGLRSRDFCSVTSGYVLGVIALAGGEGGDVTHPQCRAGSDESCVWRATWQRIASPG
jgi:uncharacterized protein (TIGR02265 family)